MSNQPYCFAIKCVATKIKYPAAYPGGFLEMARSLLVAGDPDAPIVHVCGGMANHYNNGTNWGYGIYDKRIDIDPAVKPDLLLDVRELDSLQSNKEWRQRFSAAIIDRDYNTENAARHATGVDTWPQNLRKLTIDTFELVRDYGFIGVLDFNGPNLPGDTYRQVFNVQVLMPGPQKVRQFSVWQQKMPASVYWKQVKQRGKAK